MKIVCGTDFTACADAAAEAALAIAGRTRGSLRLVHVVDADDTGPGSAPGSTAEGGVGSLETRLRADAGRLGGSGVALEVAVLRGHPDEVVTAEAKRLDADLVVVGALGRRKRPRWHLGSTADRIAQHSHCAVLVVRAAEPLVAWARDQRSLRVVASIDVTPTSKAPLDWLGRLTSHGPCTVVGAHVYWPPEARDRLHLHGPIPIGKGHPEVDAAIERELRESLGALIGTLNMELRIVGGLGRVADHLVAIAEDENADVLAVGAHQRHGFERLWHGSISHSVIDAAPMNVLCVPSR